MGSCAKKYRIPLFFLNLLSLCRIGNLSDLSLHIMLAFNFLEARAGEDTPFIVMVHKGRLRASATVLQLYPHVVSDHDYSYLLPAHLVTIRGHTEIARLLIREDVSLFRRKDADGHTPVCSALMRGFTDIVELLLNADPTLFEVVDAEDLGNTPVHVAASCNQLSTITWMLHHRPEWFHVPNSEGNTPVHCAVYGKGFGRHVELVKMLLQVLPGAFDVPNAVGNTPIHAAVTKLREYADPPDVEMVRLLLVACPERFHVANMEGKTAAMYIAESPDAALQTLLT